MEKSKEEPSNEGEGKELGKTSESSEDNHSEDIITEPIPFNELAQGYYPMDELKTDPTYEEMIIECSSKTAKSLKYLEEVLKTKSCYIFPEKQDLEFHESGIEESKYDMKSYDSDEKSGKGSFLVPDGLAIEVGKLESLNNDSLAGDDASHNSRESIFALGAPAPDYSRKARLSKVTPLMVACMCKNHKVVKLLIKNAKKIRRWDNAAMSTFLNMQLIDKKGGLNPILIACNQGDYIIFQYLVKKGADINVKNSYHQSLLHIATKNNHLNIINILLEHRSLDFGQEDLNGMNAFSFACSIGNEEVVDIFLAYRVKCGKEGKRSFEIDCRDKLNLTPLMKAATHGYYNIVLKLLKYGANPRTRNNFGESALALSCMQENYEICERLIIAKANVNEVDYCKRTPLLKAARHNTDYSILELLLKNGAKTDIADENGNTPLHHAAIRGSEIVAEFLLNLGANPYSLNKKEQVPYELCADKSKVAFQVCPLCLKKANVSCKHCSVMKYCSIDCAKRDWPDHKKTVFPKKEPSKQSGRKQLGRRRTRPPKKS
ncbi:unnamed protein product [Moneuplotes crassus]|uniref:MYND-type domain-containing protein n=1 Tax=Euplotes crassus TaxID=5936 RepID=A0AAD1UCR7_EUPCR|nr:unnamed protein product [Moneuplotes crassus]